MRAQIRSALKVEILDDERARLLAPFVVSIDGERLEVPQGFVTDFSSVPRIPLAYWLTGGKAKKAAVVHDWLYSVGSCERAWCDDVYCALARAGRLAPWRRGLMWAGVRLGGWANYGKAAP